MLLTPTTLSFGDFRPFAQVFQACYRGCRIPLIRIGVGARASLSVKWVGGVGYARAVAATGEYTEEWPGQSLGLPKQGRASLAPWRSRITALVLDWAISMILAWAIFGIGALRGNDWRSFTILLVFFVQSSVLTALAGGSAGKLITRIGVLRLDGQPMGFPRAIGRQFMVCLAIPALVIGMHRRGLHDLTVGTVVVNRR